MTRKGQIGFGTAAIGRPLYINVKQGQEPSEFHLETFKEQGKAMLDAAYRAGIRYFDTAPGYGMAEALLIDWLVQKNDKDLVLATKWGYTYVANFDPNAVRHEVKEHSIEKLNEQWSQSKKLLPHLKYYQIHSATIESGVLENQEVLERLFELKKTYDLKVGITVTGANQARVLEKAMAIEFDGASLFEVFQCTYNILDQSIASVGQSILRSGKKLVIKEALANGRLLAQTSFPAYASLYERLEEYSIKYQVGVDAIALQFCMASFPGATVLSGAQTPEQLIQNCQSLAFELTDPDLEVLNSFAVSPKSYWDERSKLVWN